MDIQRRDRELNPGSVVHSAEEEPLHYMLIDSDLMTWTFFRNQNRVPNFFQPLRTNEIKEIIHLVLPGLQFIN